MSKEPSRTPRAGGVGEPRELQEPRGGITAHAGACPAPCERCAQAETVRKLISGFN